MRASRGSTKPAAMLVDSSTQHPSRNAGGCGAGAWVCRAIGSPCSACAWAVRSAARKCRQIRGPPSRRWARGRRSGRCACGCRDVWIWRSRASAIRSSRASPRVSKTTAGCAAFELELYSDGGWSLDLSDPVLWRALFHCDNAYLIPALDASGWVCKTHKTSQTAFRGFGGPQGMLVIEDILDRVARTLGSRPATSCANAISIARAM